VLVPLGHPDTGVGASADGPGTVHTDTTPVGLAADGAGSRAGDLVPRAHGQTLPGPSQANIRILVNATATEGHQPWRLASSATMAVLARTEGVIGREGQGISVRGSVLYFTGHLLWSHEGCRGGWRRLVHTVRVTDRRGPRDGDPWGLCVFRVRSPEQPRPQP